MIPPWRFLVLIVLLLLAIVVIVTAREAKPPRNEQAPSCRGGALYIRIPCPYESDAAAVCWHSCLNDR